MKRIPLEAEPISGINEVVQYDRYSGFYMLPEYKYFVWKILRTGIRDGRVLDIGTGSGRLAIELAKARDNTFQVIGLDISENMLKRARKNAIEAGVENKIRFVQATASKLPFPEKSFDLVVSYASLHHWLNPVTVFNEAQRVVKNEGIVIIRDNRRVYGSPFWETCIWLVTRFMSNSQRKNWSKAILASYTLNEVTALVKESRLRNSRIDTDFVKFDLFIEWTKH